PGGGWASQLLSRALLRPYDAERRGVPAAPPPLPIRYVDYAAWQRERLARGALAASEQFWIECLGGELPIPPLPPDRPPGAAQTGRTHARQVVCDRTVADALAAAGREYDCTPFIAQLALLDAFLFRVSGQSDLLVGSPVAGRDQPETEGIVGFFLNTLVFRASLGVDPTFAEALARVKAASLDAYAHQEFPFDLLVQRLNP